MIHNAEEWENEEPVQGFAYIPCSFAAAVASSIKLIFFMNKLGLLLRDKIRPREVLYCLLNLKVCGLWKSNYRSKYVSQV